MKKLLAAYVIIAALGYAGFYILYTLAPVSIPAPVMAALSVAASFVGALAGQAIAYLLVKIIDL